ncbi:hypothetical protein BGZ94_001316 [Podila epigama]|nr:hypothetical protein BGZ94_001316 [Podila epigama]
MATFSSKTFNSIKYQFFRPGYNANFFKMVYDYHGKSNGQFDTAVDVGTGTGQVASVLAEKFKHVHGVDPSAKMLEAAVQKPNITYHVAKGEDLSALPSASVDLLTIAQALHWLDHPRFFSEVKRVLKPKGTFAAVGYTFVHFVNYPRASQRIIDLGDQPEQLGTCWDHGRLILDNMYKSIDVPLGSVERHYISSGHVHHGINRQKNNDAELPPIMADKVSMAHFRNYIKTWSAYNNYSEKHPDRPDIVDQMIDAILKEENLKEEDQVDITWPCVVILGRND